MSYMTDKSRAWLWAVNQGWGRGSVDLQLYEGSVQEGEQLYWKVSLVRLGYDPNDADAWVEEPVTDPDDVNEFEVDLGNPPTVTEAAD